MRSSPRLSGLVRPSEAEGFNSTLATCGALFLSVIQEEGDFWPHGNVSIDRQQIADQLMILILFDWPSQQYLFTSAHPFSASNDLHRQPHAFEMQPHMARAAERDQVLRVVVRLDVILTMFIEVVNMKAIG